MSYHEIEFVQRWTVRCRKCAFIADTTTAGEAERCAIAHIEEESADNYDHRLVIQQATLVARQP